MGANFSAGDPAFAFSALAEHVLCESLDELHRYSVSDIYRRDSVAVAPHGVLRWKCGAVG